MGVARRDPGDSAKLGRRYEIDARQIPSNWTTGYWLQGTDQPGDAPAEFYGTEVFELNTNLRDKVHEYIKDVQLNDTEEAATYR